MPLTSLCSPSCWSRGARFPRIAGGNGGHDHGQPSHASVGAFFFGLLADRYGRRWPLMLDIVFYSIVESSPALPQLRVFFILRLLYGIGMGGEWGVGRRSPWNRFPQAAGILSDCSRKVMHLETSWRRWSIPGISALGWRAMFFVGGLPALLSLFIFAKVKETEAWHQSRTDWGAYGRALPAIGSCSSIWSC